MERSLWCKTSCLPPLASQHSSQKDQLQKILQVSLNCLPNVEKEPIESVYPHPNDTNYLVVKFRSENTTLLAKENFKSMNLGYKITQDLIYQPLLICLESPRKKSSPTTTTVVTRKDEWVEDRENFDLSCSWCYICDKNGPRQVMVNFIDDEYYYCEDGSNIPRSPLRRRQEKIRFVWMRAPKKRRVNHYAAENEKSEPPRPTGDDIKRVLVEFETNSVFTDNFKAVQNRNRYFPSHFTIGELLKSAMTYCTSELSAPENIINESYNVKFNFKKDAPEIDREKEIISHAIRLDQLAKGKILKLKIIRSSERPLNVSSSNW